MTKNGWKPRKLNELGLVGRGKSRHRPRNAPELYGGPHPFVQTADIMGSEFYITTYSQTYSDAGLAQSKLWEPNTLCITNAGANTGESAILGIRACFPDSVIAFVADESESDVRFVKYYLDTIIQEIRAITRGATQDNLSVDKLLTFNIPTPPVATQCKIASILSAYDDLIENNTRRIAILEEMAQAIYREWFVNFRFPGHENVKLVDSPLGQIPEGWEPTTLGELLSFQIGGGWGTESADDDHTEIGAVIRGTDIPDSKHMNVSTCPIRFHKESNIRSRRLQNGDIVFEVSGGSKGQPVGRSVFVSDRLLACFAEDVICASFCKLIRPNGEKLPSSLFFHYLLESYTNGVIEQYEVQSTGIKNFKFTEFLAREQIAVPPKAIQGQFDMQFQTIQSQIEILGKKTSNLRTTRDLLLPKLISGKLDVSDLDIDVGLTAEAMEEATA